MAVYKVIQDVEAEDKLLGPLTFKSFIYAIIAGTCAFIEFRLVLIGSPIKYPFIIMFLVPMVLFGVLASPLGRDQPTEVWLLSKIRFYLKPRLRIWNQEGIDELVTVTVPKKIEQRLTKDLTQTEVHSRLKTLASTLDTRGWAVRNVETNLNAVAPQAPVVIHASDRLVANTGYNQPAPVVDVHAADDIMDEQNNPTAQKFAALMQKADDDRRQSVLKTMRNLVSDSSEDELTDQPSRNNLKERLDKAKSAFAKDHHHAKAKIAKSSKAPEPLVKNRPQTKPPAPLMTPERQAVNMELAQSGSAFSVATLSQLANRQPQVQQDGPNEVTISLH